MTEEERRQATADNFVIVQNVNASLDDRFASLSEMMRIRTELGTLTTPPVAVDTQVSAKGQLLSSASPGAVLERSILLSIIDALNVLRQRDVDRSADVAAATSLADLKVRWANHPPLDPITVQQAKTFVSNKIDSGAAN